jgi:branched-chain amino acid aminotransferase
VKVFLNGRLVTVDAAALDIADRGFTLGDGLYETIAVKDGRPARLPAHLARLRRGLGVIGLALAETDAALEAALGYIVRANDIEEGVLRLTVTRGPAPRGLMPPERPTPTLLIVGRAQRLGDRPPARAVVATGTRRNEHSPLSRIKTTNCLDAILALKEAAAKGADEALLLNTKGNLAEAAAANLFLVIGGRAVTPPIADGALAGIMRADLLRHIDAAERTLKPADIGQASEAFLTSSLGVRPLVAVDGIAVGDGRPGPVCKKSQEIAWTAEDAVRP